MLAGILIHALKDAAPSPVDTVAALIMKSGLGPATLRDALTEIGRVLAPDRDDEARCGALRRDRAGSISGAAPALPRTAKGQADARTVGSTGSSPRVEVEVSYSEVMGGRLRDSVLRLVVNPRKAKREPLAAP